jgi:hypothetical protein
MYGACSLLTTWRSTHVYLALLGMCYRHLSGVGPLCFKFKSRLIGGSRSGILQVRAGIRITCILKTAFNICTSFALTGTR